MKIYDMFILIIWEKSFARYIMILERGEIMSIRCEEIQWEPYGKCALLTNGEAEIIVTLDVGPRIMRYAKAGGSNILAEKLPNARETEWGTYRLKGGHRIWHAPEAMPRSYEPDDEPVESWCPTQRGIRVRQRTETHAGMQKELELVLDDEGTGVRLVQKLTNRNAWPVEAALWSLTVVTTGGWQIIPVPRHDTGLLHNRTLTLWPYTHMNDERVRWGDRLIYLKQDPQAKEPFKLGIDGRDGWAAYWLHDLLFIKRYQPQPGAIYPDGGMTYETFTNHAIMEIETLSPMMRMAPGEGIEHEERWVLKEGVTLSLSDPEEVARYIESC